MTPRPLSLGEGSPGKWLSPCWAPLSQRGTLGVKHPHAWAVNHRWPHRNGSVQRWQVGGQRCLRRQPPACLYLAYGECLPGGRAERLSVLRKPKDSEAPGLGWLSSWAALSEWRTRLRGSFPWALHVCCVHLPCLRGACEGCEGTTHRHAGTARSSMTVELNVSLSCAVFFMIGRNCIL